MSALGSEVFVAVRIGGGLRLVELEHVREIVPAMLLRRPSTLHATCRGVAAIRGEVVPVFDLVGRPGPLDLSQFIVIVRFGARNLLGILVDDVVDVIELGADALLAHATGGGTSMRAATVMGGIAAVLTADEVLHA